MKGIQTAFNGKSNTDYGKNDQHGNLIDTRSHNLSYFFLGRAHEKMTRYII